MKSPYDEYYQTEDLFGAPYPELVTFFAEREQRGKVLDLGCGQGRDAIAFGRLAKVFASSTIRPFPTRSWIRPAVIVLKRPTEWLWWRQVKEKPPLKRNVTGVLTSMIDPEDNNLQVHLGNLVKDKIALVNHQLPDAPTALGGPADVRKLF